MAAWTEAALLAGERDEHLVVAVGATDAGEAEVKIAAAKESAGHLTEDRSVCGFNWRTVKAFQPP